MDEGVIQAGGTVQAWGRMSFETLSTGGQAKHTPYSEILTQLIQQNYK